MLIYKKDEPLQKLRDIIFSYFISHPEEAKPYARELQYLRTANSFYDFVIPFENPNKNYQKPNFRGNIDGYQVFDWKGKQMFLPYNNSGDAGCYLESILIEQSENSPHQYQGYKKSGKTLVDVGAAEGFFALENVEGFENVVLVEAAPQWVLALTKTFNRYNNTKLIQSFVSKENGLGEMLKGFDLNNSVIKLDIEGYEIEALESLNERLRNENCSDLEILVCCYHKPDHFEKVLSFAYQNNFKVEINDGHMLFVYDNLEPPFFRRGVIRLWR